MDKRRKQRVMTKVLAKVEVSRVHFYEGTPCWDWQGPCSGNGRGGKYPRMSLDGQTVAVHRVTYTDKFGYVPGKKQIDHLCNRRCCVNPDHLEMVTHKENQRRRDKRIIDKS